MASSCGTSSAPRLARKIAGRALALADWTRRVALRTVCAAIGGPGRTGAKVTRESATGCGGVGALSATEVIGVMTCGRIMRAPVVSHLSSGPIRMS